MTIGHWATCHNQCYIAKVIDKKRKNQGVPKNEQSQALNNVP